MTYNNGDAGSNAMFELYQAQQPSTPVLAAIVQTEGSADDWTTTRRTIVEFIRHNGEPHTSLRHDAGVDYCWSNLEFRMRKRDGAYVREFRFR